MTRSRHPPKAPCCHILTLGRCLTSQKKMALAHLGESSPMGHYCGVMSVSVTTHPEQADAPLKATDRAVKRLPCPLELLPNVCHV